MVRDNAANEASNDATPDDFIEQQLKRLDQQSKESAFLAQLTRESERSREELVRLQSELRLVGERWARADAALNAVRVGAQRVSMILAVAVTLLGMVLWYFLAVSRHQPTAGGTDTGELTPTPPAVTPPPPAVHSKALHVIGRIRSDTFASNASDCAPDRGPCGSWHRDEPATHFDSFDAAVKALVANISAPGPLMFVVEGGHDSDPVGSGTKAEVSSNLDLAMLRAYYARTELEQLLRDSNFDVTYISTVRSSTPRTGKLDSDRRVTITLLAAVQPQG